MIFKSKELKMIYVKPILLICKCQGILDKCLIISTKNQIEANLNHEMCLRFCVQFVLTVRICQIEVKSNLSEKRLEAET